jgi:N-methylhydantoinase A
MYEGSVEGMPVQSPWVDVRSIGAGGGSLARVDVGGLLRVGPSSAGADPGPACYGRGGTEPTVTDAAFVLGMLGEGQLASGISLDLERAHAALGPLAERLALDVFEVARGVLTIAAANMANAIREITIERGRDPRDAVLMPFGGAGPLFATLLARELEIGKIVVPPHAGNFSAWGLLGADLTQTGARTKIVRLDDDAIPEVDEVLSELFGSLGGRSEVGGERAREVRLDMRYAGQEHTLTVAVGCNADGGLAVRADDIHAIFTADYDRTFGHVMDEPTEIVAIRATVRTALQRRVAERAAAQPTHAGGEHEAWSFTRQAMLPFRVVDRAAIGADGVAGPAILLEETATTYLDADFIARPGDLGVIEITDTAASR